VHSDRSRWYRPTRSLTLSGHFGEFLQGRIGSGPVALVTLPAPMPVVTVTAVPTNNFGVHASDGLRAVDLRRVRQVAAIDGMLPRLTFVTRYHMRPGSGTGTSTATLLAIREMVSRSPQKPEDTGALLARIEGATDPLMFPDPAGLLWASREGRVLGQLPKPPAFDVIGGFFGPPTPTNPKDQDFPDISDLVGDWKAAALVGDHARLGELATESALRTTRHKRRPLPDALMECARATRAVGIAIAHTGSARALLFRPGEGDRQKAADLSRDIGLKHVVCFRSQ
jgi:uncharacterized protein involved in propanediol utilization